MSDGNEWIEWHGGDCPVADGVAIKLVMRFEESFPNHDAYLSVNDASSFNWSHEGHSGDIIKYRIVGSAK